MQSPPCRQAPGLAQAARLAHTLGAWLVACGLAGCSSPPPPEPLRIPHGYLARLELKHGGQRYGFGPFVGYYFRPVRSGDLKNLEFVCFNEQGFYASDAPVNRLLYRGEAVFAELPAVEFDLPAGPERIQPVFFSEAPAAWREARPSPQEEFRHFHSCYDSQGAARLGYWLRHRAEAAFTYDMGGRVGPGSSLYHRAQPGPDREFAQIVEFDRGPAANR